MENTIDLSKSSFDVEVFEMGVRNIKDALIILLKNSVGGYCVDAQMIGQCFDFLDELKNNRLVGNSPGNNC